MFAAVRPSLHLSNKDAPAGLTPLISSPPPSLPPSLSLSLSLQSVYVSHSYYISQQAESVLFGYPITAPIAAALFLLGFICIAINYDADRQRSLARSTDGECIIWGKKATIQRVKYVTETGETKSTILLTSGWWSLSRHFHYVPEILASLFWALPAGSKDFMPYVYVAFLTILLLDRGNRDDARMKSKYNNKHGQYFEAYCKVVPYLFIPGVY
jgi:7-dehydrocholesterol reductase